LGLTQPMV